MREEMTRSLIYLKREHLYVTGIRDPEVWLLLERKMKVKVANQFRELYSITNGFDNYHHGSQLILWDIKKITEENGGQEGSDERDLLFRIGDFLIESDYLVTDFSKEHGEVRLLYDGRVLSKDVASFLIDLADRKFDFL